jgi:type I restriction enzyme S subunit
VVKPGSADPDGVKFVRSGDLLNGRILTDQLRTIESDVSSQYRRTLLSGGEVLLSIVGNPGQVAIVPESLKGANIARQVALLKMRDSDIALFIKSFLLSPIGRDALGAITLGSVQKVINLKDLRNLPVLLPSPMHFKKFGQISEITESLSNSLHRQIELLDEIRLLLFARMTGLKD